MDVFNIFPRHIAHATKSLNRLEKVIIMSNIYSLKDHCLVESELTQALYIGINFHSEFSRSTCVRHAPFWKFQGGQSGVTIVLVGYQIILAKYCHCSSCVFTFNPTATTRIVTSTRPTHNTRFGQNCRFYYLLVFLYTHALHEWSIYTLSIYLTIRCGSYQLIALSSCLPNFRHVVKRGLG